MSCLSHGVVKCKRPLCPIARQVVAANRPKKDRTTGVDFSSVGVELNRSIDTFDRDI